MDVRFLRCLAVALLPIFFSCPRIDLSSRKESVLPVCLIVSSTPWSWQKYHVQEAAEQWNVRLGWRAFSVSPDCQKGDDFVPLAFVRQLPWECGMRGCTKTHMRVNGVPVMREVLIQEDAPFSTLMHELGHLAGCNHDDMAPPCI